MITNVLAANFRSLARDVEVRLDPLTVLVGANGVGKSNVADVLRFVGDAVRDGLPSAIASRHGFFELRRRSDDELPNDVSIMLDVRLGETRWSWGLGLTSDSRDEFRVKWEFADASPDPQRHRTLHDVFHAVPGPADRPVPWSNYGGVFGADTTRHGGYFVENGLWQRFPRADLALALAPPSPRALMLSEVAKLDPRVHPLAEYLSSLIVYSLFPPTLRTPQSSDPTRPMRRQGENWASHLRSLDRPTQGAELLAALSRIVGDIDDYRVTPAGGFLIPEFQHGGDRPGDRWFGAAQESDGTLRMAGILTALLQSPSPSLIGIEEPELAVHPGALPILVDYLKQASTHTQVLVTTHSPEILDLVDPAVLRVVERGADGTTVSGLARDQLDVLRKHLCGTSDLLRAEGLRGAERG